MSLVFRILLMTFSVSKEHCSKIRKKVKPYYFYWNIATYGMKMSAT